AIPTYAKRGRPLAAPPQDAEQATPEMPVSAEKMGTVEAADYSATAAAPLAAPASGASAMPAATSAAPAPDTGAVPAAPLATPASDTFSTMTARTGAHAT